VERKVTLRERLEGPKVSDRAFYAAAHATRGVWLPNMDNYPPHVSRQYINSWWQIAATVATFVPATVLFATDHVIVAGTYLLAALLLLATPVAFWDYRRIRRLALDRFTDHEQTLGSP
jgi:hypothetical protein